MDYRAAFGSVAEPHCPQVHSEAYTTRPGSAEYSPGAFPAPATARESATRRKAGKTPSRWDRVRLGEQRWAQNLCQPLPPATRQKQNARPNSFSYFAKYDSCGMGAVA